MAAGACFATGTRLASAFMDRRFPIPSGTLPDLASIPNIHQGISIHAWQADHAEDTDTAPTPDIVIETFACELPDNVQSIIRRHQPLWLNWEYLSAEDSNERLHLMPSPQAGGIQKYFWFMGFSEKAAACCANAITPNLPALIRKPCADNSNFPQKTRPNGCFSAIKAIFGQNG